MRIVEILHLRRIVFFVGCRQGRARVSQGASRPVYECTSPSPLETTIMDHENYEHASPEPWYHSYSSMSWISGMARGLRRAMGASGAASEASLPAPLCYVGHGLHLPCP